MDDGRRSLAWSSSASLQRAARGRARRPPASVVRAEEQPATEIV